jgi:hypothetical protein
MCPAGCTAENLTMIRPGRMPRAARDKFLADVERLATQFGADPVRLAEVLRRVEVLTGLPRTEPAATEADFLLAVQDRDAEGEVA